MSIDDLIPDPSEDAQQRVYVGTILDTPADVDEDVRVRLDVDRDQALPGCRWSPRGAHTPAAGDPCVVAFDDTDRPTVVWWGLADTDLESVATTAALEDHAALATGVHGLPEDIDAGQGVVWNGTGWDPEDFATAADVAAEATARTAAISAHEADTTSVHGIANTALLIPQKVVRKTADETVNNSATLQDDNHLALTVAASEIWTVDLRLLLSAANTTADWKFAFTVPAAATFYWHGEGSSGSWSPQAVANPAALLTTGTLMATSDNNTHGIHLLGTYIGGANAGTLQFQWAQNTANATDSKVLTNSALIATRIS